MPVTQTIRNIKTMSARVDRVAHPYLAYMQITCLEMEKARKGRERASATKRLQDLEERLREIDQQKAALLEALAQRAAAPRSDAVDSVRPHSGQRASGALKLRY